MHLFFPKKVLSNFLYKKIFVLYSVGFSFNFLEAIAIAVVWINFPKMMARLCISVSHLYTILLRARI